MKWNRVAYILLISMLVMQGLPLQAQDLPIDQGFIDHGKVLEFDVGIELVTVRYGEGQLVSVPSPCKTISIGNPNVCDVVMMGAHEFMLVGKKTGQTNMYVWLENDMKLESNIRVYDDTNELVKLLAKILPYEADINVSIAHNTLILSGYVEKPTSIENAQRIAEAYMEGRDSTEGISIKVVNMLKMREEKQILLEVRLAEVVRSAADKFGLDWRYQGDLFGAPTDTSWLDGGTPARNGANTAGILIPDTNGAQGTSVGSFSWDGGSKSFVYGLDYLVSEGFAKVIAKPNLMVRNGEEASFLAGGEFPVPIETDNSIQIEWKEYGVRLTFSPTLDERDNIDLVLAPEVSVLDYSDATVQISGTQIPALKTRRTETKVRLRDGESFYVSGLISQSESETLAKTPGISNIPVLGELFKSKDNSFSETDLVVFVTPRLVKPFKKDIDKRFDDAEQMRLIANSSRTTYEQPHGDAIREFIEQGEKPEKSLEELKAEAIEEAIRELVEHRAQEVDAVIQKIEACEDNKARNRVLELEEQRKMRADRRAEKAQAKADEKAAKKASRESARKVREEKELRCAEAEAQSIANQKAVAEAASSARKMAREKRLRIKKEEKEKKIAEKKRLKAEAKRAKEEARAQSSAEKKRLAEEKKRQKAIAEREKEEAKVHRAAEKRRLEAEKKRLKEEEARARAAARRMKVLGNTREQMNEN